MRIDTVVLAREEVASQAAQTGVFRSDETTLDIRTPVLPSTRRTLRFGGSVGTWVRMNKIID
ncbi:hypothetical protein ACFV9E_39430 [Streptomyces sp. NPDC059835]|uniref:hypothetical protein n=1 Tax=Streptomyces sp. NPDC059835 TaxID=3346967 RepID=UPI0036549AA3